MRFLDVSKVLLPPLVVLCLAIYCVSARNVPKSSYELPDDAPAKIPSAAKVIAEKPETFARLQVPLSRISDDDSDAADSYNATSADDPIGKTAKWTCPDAAAPVFSEFYLGLASIRAMECQQGTAKNCACTGLGKIPKKYPHDFSNLLEPPADKVKDCTNGAYCIDFPIMVDGKAQFCQGDPGIYRLIQRCKGSPPDCVQAAVVYHPGIMGCPAAKPNCFSLCQQS